MAIFKTMIAQESEPSSNIQIDDLRPLAEQLRQDDNDSLVADEAYREFEAGGRRSRPISELWKDCGL